MQHDGRRTVCRVRKSYGNPFNATGGEAMKCCLAYHREQMAKWELAIEQAQRGRWQDVLSDGMRAAFAMYFKHRRAIRALKEQP
jgi:hypothetical protein